MPLRNHFWIFANSYCFHFTISTENPPFCHEAEPWRILWLTKRGTRTGHGCLNEFSPEKAGRVSRKGGSSPPPSQARFSRQQSLERSGILLNAIQGSLVTETSAYEFMPNRLLTLPGPPTLSQCVQGAGSRLVHPALGSIFLSQAPAVGGLKGEDLTGLPSYLPLVPSGWSKKVRQLSQMTIRVTPWDTSIQSSFLLYRLGLKNIYFLNSWCSLSFGLSNEKILLWP